MCIRDRDTILLIAVLITGGMLMARWYREKNRPRLSELTAPEWYTQDFLQINPYSRPGTKRREINHIVVHYVANPGTTAAQNRSYFNNLANQTGEKATSASSHYTVSYTHLDVYKRQIQSSSKIMIFCLISDCCTHKHFLHSSLLE